jgi:hypothetical protein
LRQERLTWRVFARSAFVPLRSALLRLADTLRLEATATSRELLSFIEAVSTDAPPYSDYYLIADVTPAALPRQWRRLVLDDPSDPGAFNRRQLEVVAILELAAAIQAGEMFVAGSLSYDRFWDRLPTRNGGSRGDGGLCGIAGLGQGRGRLYSDLERLP